MKAQNYETIYEIGKLLEAHERARKGKRGKKEVIQYELNLAWNLCETAEKLRQKQYTPERYNEFKVYEPKERKIQALHYKDRIIQHTVCDNILTPYLETRLIYDNAACRKGKGTHFALKRLKRFLTEYAGSIKIGRIEHGEKPKKQGMLREECGTKGYFLKADIRKYFANIDHEVLKTKLAKERLDENTKQLLNKIIDSYNEEKGKGLPIGNQTSQAFALYYLDEIDRYIKEKARIKHYIRYMDEMILIHQNKQKLRQTLKGMTEIAKRLKLEFNEKTQITPIQKGIDFLGWHFWLTDTGKVILRLRQSAKRRIFARLKQLQKGYANGTTTPEEIDQSIAAILGHLDHGNTYNLKKEILKRFKLTKKQQ